MNAHQRRKQRRVHLKEIRKLSLKSKLNEKKLNINSNEVVSFTGGEVKVKL